MKLNKKQQKVSENIAKLNTAINTAIDGICKESDFQITYAEINSALTDRLKRNLDYELKTMWQKDKA